MRRTELTWRDVYDRIDTIRNGVANSGIWYGVPRGGAVVAGIMGAMGFAVTSQEQQADTIVDDIIDSGVTRAKYDGRRFLALVDKRKPEDAALGWVVFPWEGTAELDGADIVRRQIEFVGEDPNREGLRKTPERVTRWWREMTWGYGQDATDILSSHFHGEGYDQMVILRGVDFYSTCEHHLLPFHGTAHIAYVPNERIVGLSKMARLVECFARRLQIQERMTQQIAEAMNNVLKPKGVAVMLTAQHLCMACRGVQKHRSDMVTTCLKGVFSKHVVRDEFLAQCHNH